MSSSAPEPTLAPVDTSLRSLLTLAWPVIVARSSQAVVGFADALMSAPLGEAPLAAVTTGAMNTYWMAVLPMGTVFIVQSFASQLAAKGHHQAAVRYAWYALILSAAALVLGLGAIPFIGPALRLLDYSPSVLASMTIYLQIRMLAIGGIVATEALGNWYGGLGKTRLHMMAGIITMVSNVFLNWILIYGNFGVPALGVAGAAIASVVAVWLGFAAVGYAFARGWAVGHSVKPNGLQMSELLRMLRFGIPNGFNWFLEFAAFAFFVNVVVAHLGTTALAAMMVVININSVSFMPAFGLSTAGAILCGQAIGAGYLPGVSRVVRRTMGVAATWQGLVGMCYFAFPDALMGWFSPTDESHAIVDVGAKLLAISAAWQLFDAVAMTLGEALRAAGDTMWTMWARVVIAWAVFSPGAAVWVMWLDGGHVGAMLSVVVYVAVLACAFAWRYRSGVWQRIDLTGLSPEI